MSADKRLPPFPACDLASYAATDAADALLTHWDDCTRDGHPLDAATKAGDIAAVIGVLETWRATFGAADAETRTYAGLSWCAEDVQALREDLTPEQAEAFLIRNEKYLRDRLCELGWDVMSNYLSMETHEGKLPSQPNREGD